MPQPEDIFIAARELTDPVERAAYLAEASGEDAGLRHAVESLLADAAAATQFFGDTEPRQTEPLDPGGLKSPLAAFLPREGPGSVIGRYRLLHEIGHGGMGEVYVAEQFEPIVRRVALKIIRLGMDTREVVARFEAERQALALMDHPNIAKVFDAGSTDSGRPYFVMELVPGIPITQFCDEQKLGTRERLELFMQVCVAVQHAHQKGIIHRDLKPTNILVPMNTLNPLPKVIDFGIAKAIERPLTDDPFSTRDGQILGTPAYMSPEQAGLEGLDVDTRSDIYSLGVLLYELLVGQPPFDPKTLQKVGREAMFRILREEDPPTPSMKLTTLTTDKLTTVAQQRNADPRRLGKLLRQDLDWVVMRALEKQPNRRFATANGFAADVRRYLKGEPVESRPPSRSYRFTKLFRKHHKQLAMAAGALVLAALGLVGLSAAHRAKYAVTVETKERLRILYASDEFLATLAVSETNLAAFPELFRGLDLALARRPAHPALWTAIGILSQKTNGLSNAYSAYSKAIASAGTNDQFVTFKTLALSNRCQVLRSMHRFAEAGQEFRKLTGLPVLDRVDGLGSLPDYHRSNTVSMEFGTSNREQGLYFIKWSDSRHRLRYISGRETQYFDSGWNYAYFFLDPTFKWNLNSNATIKVEYQSSDGSPIGIQYNGALGAYTAGTRAADTLLDGGWRMTEFRLADAYFRNEGNGRSDFRLCGNQSGFYLRRIVVSAPILAPVIPRRSSTCPPGCVDLTAFYNAGLDHDLQGDAASDNSPSGLVAGTREISGIHYDVRGVIQLSCRERGERNQVSGCPEVVTNIPLRRRFTQLHCLHGTDGKVPDGTKIGCYILHYAGGQQIEIPIVYGEDLRNWWNIPGTERTQTKRAVVAWTGENPAVRLAKGTLRLFSVSYQNPHPESVVTSVDFTSAMTKCSPFLLAMTVEDCDPVQRQVKDALALWHGGNPAEAIRLLDAQIAKLPSNPQLLEAKAELLLSRGDTSAALKLLNAAIGAYPQTNRLGQPWYPQIRGEGETVNLTQSRTHSESEAWGYALKWRQTLLLQSLRIAAAGRDNCRYLGIPLRGEELSPNLVDLSAYYNASLEMSLAGSLIPSNTLASLPMGVRELAGTQFDIRGLIALSSTHVEAVSGRDSLPRAATNIVVGFKCNYLHCLLGTRWIAEDGAPIATLVLHFADGRTHEAAILYGEHLRDWCEPSTRDGIPVRQAQLAWVGENPAVRGKNRQLHLYNVAFKNPHQGVELSSLDFVSAMTKSSPFLIGLTVSETP